MGRFLGGSAKGCAPTCPAFESTESAATSSRSIPRVPESGNDPINVSLGVFHVKHLRSGPWTIRSYARRGTLCIPPSMEAERLSMIEFAIVRAPRAGH